MSMSAFTSAVAQEYNTTSQKTNMAEDVKYEDTDILLYESLRQAAEEKDDHQRLLKIIDTLTRDSIGKIYRRCDLVPIIKSVVRLHREHSGQFFEKFPKEVINPLLSSRRFDVSQSELNKPTAFHFNLLAYVAYFGTSDGLVQIISNSSKQDLGSAIEEIEEKYIFSDYTDVMPVNEYDGGGSRLITETRYAYWSVLHSIVKKHNSAVLELLLRKTASEVLERNLTAFTVLVAFSQHSPSANACLLFKTNPYSIEKLFDYNQLVVTRNIMSEAEREIYLNMVQSTIACNYSKGALQHLKNADNQQKVLTLITKLSDFLAQSQYSSYEKIQEAIDWDNWFKLFEYISNAVNTFLPNQTLDRIHDQIHALCGYIHYHAAVSPFKKDEDLHTAWKHWSMVENPVNIHPRIALYMGEALAPNKSAEDQKHFIFRTGTFSQEDWQILYLLSFFYGLARTAEPTGQETLLNSRLFVLNDLGEIELKNDANVEFGLLQTTLQRLLLSRYQAVTIDLEKYLEKRKSEINYYPLLSWITGWYGQKDYEDRARIYGELKATETIEAKLANIDENFRLYPQLNQGWRHEFADLLIRARSYLSMACSLERTLTDQTEQRRLVIQDVLRQSNIDDPNILSPIFGYDGICIQFKMIEVSREKELAYGHRWASPIVTIGFFRAICEQKDMKEMPIGKTKAAKAAKAALVVSLGVINKFHAPS